MEGVKPPAVTAASVAAELQKTIKDEDELSVEEDEKVAQDNDKERRWVETLLSCSEEPDDEEFAYIGKILCNDWNQAARGWEDTVPFVRYVWGEAPSISKKRDAEEERANKRIKAHRQKVAGLPEEHSSWRRCVEPRTFRYVYDPKGLHRTTLKFYNGITLERALEEDGFSEHILKLREYLEKTLTHAKKETSNGIKEHAQLGQYFAAKSSPRRLRREKHSSGKKGVGKLRGLGDGLFIQSDVSEPEDESDASATFKGIEGRGLDDALMPFKNDRQATPILPIRKVEKHNGQLIRNPPNPSSSPKLKLSHSPSNNKLSQSPNNSYEKFPAQSVGPLDLTLSPLKKVTPSQRQIHDDNEVLAHSLSPMELLKPSSAKSEPDPDHTPTYKVLLERSSAPHMSSRTMNREALGMVGAKPSTFQQPVKQFPLAQELAAVGKLLRDQDQKNKSKGKRTIKPQPFKHGAAAGDAGSGKLGDPLHRGVMDRETAGAMAAELLPGVSGHKLHLPVYSQRIL